MGCKHEGTRKINRMKAKPHCLVPRGSVPRGSVPREAREPEDSSLRCRGRVAGVGEAWKTQGP